MDIVSIKNPVKKVLPYFLAFAIVALSSFLLSRYRFFNDSVHGSSIRAGRVDASGRPHFSGSFDRLKRTYGADAIEAEWNDAFIRGRLYVFDGESLAQYDGIEDLDLVSPGSNGGAGLVAGGENLVANGSFESGSWQPKVVDCNEYDKNGALGMVLDQAEKTDGKQSLQLSAKRHIACVFTAINVPGKGDHLFAFDYQSPNAKEAEFLLLFNDANKTAISRKLAITTVGWQTYRDKIAVPDGTTSVTIYLYSNAVDGKIGVVNRYDNVYFGKWAELAAIGAARGGLAVVKNKIGTWDIEVAAGYWLRWQLYLSLPVAAVALAACLGYFVAVVWKSASRRRHALAGRIPVAAVALAACLGYFVAVVWKSASRRRHALAGRIKKMADKTRSAFALVGSCFGKCFIPAANDVRRRPWLLAVSFLIGLGAGFLEGAIAGALWFVFVFHILYAWDNRIIAAAAFVSLASCSLLIWFKRVALAETMAVYSFYLLAMAAVLGIIEYARHPARFHDDQRN